MVARRRLYTDLMAGYISSVLPVRNPGDKVTVYVYMHIDTVEDLVSTKSRDVNIMQLWNNQIPINGSEIEICQYPP